MSRAAVFLDKDGTLVHDVPYNVDRRRIELTEGAGEALQMLRSQGFTLVVVTNQPGIGLGRFDAAALHDVRTHLQALLAPFGATLAGFYYCPHVPDDPRCRCRKPLPGLLERAADELDLDLSASWMVGDILNDVEAGRRAGCRSVLIDCGNETEWQLTPGRVPDFVAADHVSAADWICSRVGRRATAPEPQ